MIDRDLKRSIGQMMHGVQVIGASNGHTQRLYCSHWVMQVSFEEPLIMASVSPKHDTYPLIKASGTFAVSVLAADQVGEGQYFSYPGHKLAYSAPNWVTTWDGLPVVPRSIAWLRCEVEEEKQLVDHTLFFAKVVATSEGRLKEPPLLYSARLGWRKAGDKAREPGDSIRDTLLAQAAAKTNRSAGSTP